MTCVQAVEKTDLVGLDFLWEICLNTSDLEIAEMAITLLMNMSYCNLAPRFKRVNTMAHTDTSYNIKIIFNKEHNAFDK